MLSWHAADEYRAELVFLLQLAYLLYMLALLLMSTVPPRRAYSVLFLAVRCYQVKLVCPAETSLLLLWL